MPTYTEIEALYDERQARHLALVRKHLLTCASLGLLTDAEASRMADRHDRTKEDTKAEFVMLTWALHIGVPPQSICAINDAAERHVKSEPHHPEYWPEVCRMPLTSIAEMVSDWAAVSEELMKGSLQSWWYSNTERWGFTPRQRAEIQRCIDGITGLHVGWPMEGNESLVVEVKL